MKKLAFGALLVGLLVAACGGDDGHHPILLDSGSNTNMTCNPLTQAGCAAGEKCTWLLDALMPSYVGHVGCAPDGTANTGESCMYGAPGTTGYDNCKKGTVCGNYRGGAGTCKTICDQQGGTPDCGTTHVCVTYSGLFSTGDTTPPAGGVCDLACDPFADNDFDGSGTVSTKSGTTCAASGSNTVGCYGYPSYGTPPKTGWSCTNDINAMEAQPTGLRHRVQCVEANNCADPGPTIYVNSCNQGYLPLLIETTGVSTAICVAMCAPHNCYMGNCGTATTFDFQHGDAPHRCTATDRVGTFDQTVAGESCQYLWYREVDDQGNYLASATSNSLGFCFDHSKYLYDSDGDNTADKPLPPCSTLANGFGSGSAPSDPNYWGAADLGCVDTTNAGIMMAQGKTTQLPESTMHKRATINLPRALYHRTMGTR